MQSEKLKICLVDDNLSFREGVKFLIQVYTNWEIVHEYSSGVAFYHGIMNHEFPDIILMDYLMPGIDGISITKKLLFSFPEAKVIAVSMNASKFFYDDLISTGFKGCIQKRNFYNQIIPAVENVMKGGLFFKHKH